MTFVCLLHPSHDSRSFNPPPTSSTTTRWCEQLRSASRKVSNKNYAFSTNSTSSHSRCEIFNASQVRSHPPSTARPKGRCLPPRSQSRNPTMTSSYKTLLLLRNMSRNAHESLILRRRRELMTNTTRMLDERKARHSLPWWSSRVRRSERRIKRIARIWRSSRRMSMTRRES